MTPRRLGPTNSRTGIASLNAAVPETDPLIYCSRIDTIEAENDMKIILQIRRIGVSRTCDHSLTAREDKTQAMCTHRH